MDLEHAHIVGDHYNNKYNHSGFSTAALHAGQDPDKWKCRSVVPHIALSSTYKQFSPSVHAGFEYSRSGNPTRQVLEECLAPLEKAKYALAFSSGLGATTTLSYMLKSGDHVLSVDDVYGGTNRFFRQCAGRMGINIDFVDMRDMELTEKGLKPNTAMVWIETPTNPTLKLVDIGAVVAVVRKTHPTAIIVVDNTFASSFFQNPLLLGADIVIQSLTKYMNGHSDVVMGAVMLNDDELHARLKFLQNACGAIPSPFDCYLVNRGLKTLAVRMKEHQVNGLIVAKWLSQNPRVEKVIYPGLESHPQYDLYKKQMKGFGGMISVYLKGDLKTTLDFFRHLEHFCCAESLGGYESLVEHPALMTHASVPAEQRALLGITDNFVRISIGLEDVDDLIKDLDQALHKAMPEIGMSECTY